jgi:hypothetical protein
VIFLLSGLPETHVWLDKWREALCLGSTDHEGVKDARI